MKIILASKSPRRKEILENLGIKFDIITKETDESSNITDPSALVRELAERKGAAVADGIVSLINDNELDDIFNGREFLIISSDTVVAVDGTILGKPADITDAKRMLLSLEGREHSVFSGIAVTLMNGRNIIKKASAVEETVVRFGKMTESEIDFYVNNENVLDKAGAYAIQGIASAWIDGIDGDYFNVVGLPVRRLMKLLSDELGLTLDVLRGDI